MRQVTVTEKYRAVNEGKMAQSEFVRQMRLAYPNLISQFNGYSDTVSILKRQNMLFEDFAEPLPNNISDDSLRRALDIEIAVLGHDPVTCKDGEVQAKAKAKALANLKKDPLHYYNLLAKESSKVDKNDKMKETKRGALEKDTFNDMKKATLKEIKQNLVEGTRALVGYLSGDRLTTTYNHYDGYPENLGKGLEAHYNNDEKAKEVALKGYITYLNPETGEIEATHNDAPGKLVLPDDAQQRAYEIAEEIDKFGADFGYIWDDETNQWITINNLGIRSMAKQIMEKLSMVNIHSGEKMNSGIEETEEEYLEKRDAAIKKAMGKDVEEMMYIDDEEWEAEMGRSKEDTEKAIEKEKSKLTEDNKAVIGKLIQYLTKEKGVDVSIVKDFLKTHWNDIRADVVSGQMDLAAIGDEFDEFVSVNYEAPSDFMQEEKADKDHDGDGEVESKEDEYKGVKDKAIKKAMGKDEQTHPQQSDDEFLNHIQNQHQANQKRSGKKKQSKNEVVREHVKNIITKVLEEQVINEAATNELARIADEYGSFEGLKPAVIALQNIVTEIESFYDKTRAKVQKIYNDLGEVRNDEGLKVGAFIAPSIENAFVKDLKHITKQQFHGGLDMPKVKTITRADVDRGYIQQEAPKDTVFRPVNEKKK